MVNRLSIEERIYRAELLGIIVDDEDRWVLEHFSWRVSTKGYAETTIYAPDKQTIKLHHLVVGRPLFGLGVDHINRNKLDNRKVNLSYATRRENSLNRDWHDTSMNYKVSRNGKYEARLTVNGKYMHLGTFETIEQAENAVANYKSENGALFREGSCPFSDTKI